MTPQSAFMLVARIADGREAELRTLLAGMNAEPGIADPRNPLIPFGEFESLHFARWLILDDETLADHAAHGLPTPEFQVFERVDEPIDDDLLAPDGELRFALFVKPSREGTSMGVSAQSIVRTVDALRAQVARQIALYNQPILCEHYIEGREVMVGIIGNLKPTMARKLNERTLSADVPEGLTMLPPLEVDLQAFRDSEADLYTNRLKTELSDECTYLVPAPLDPALARELDVLAAATFRVIGCKDVARVDFRLDRHNDNKPYILEINPLPGLTPNFSDLCYQADALGWTYEQLINAIVDAAIARLGLAERQTERAGAG